MSLPTQTLPATNEETFTSETLAEALAGRDNPVPCFVQGADGIVLPLGYMAYVYHADGTLKGFILTAQRPGPAR